MGGEEMDNIMAALANEVSKSGKWPDIFKKQSSVPYLKKTK